MEIKFTVPHPPIAQPRQRHRIIKKKDGSVFVSNYTPGKHPVNALKQACKIAAMKAHTGKLLTGPIRVDLGFVFPRPKNKVWKTKPMPAEWHQSKPDIDNLAKAIYDALNGVLWVDDGQIAVCLNKKWIASGDEEACVTVSVCSWEWAKSQ